MWLYWCCMRHIKVMSLKHIINTRQQNPQFPFPGGEPWFHSSEHKVNICYVVCEVFVCYISYMHASHNSGLTTGYTAICSNVVHLFHIKCYAVILLHYVLHDEVFWISNLLKKVSMWQPYHEQWETGLHGISTEFPWGPSITDLKPAQSWHSAVIHRELRRFYVCRDVPPDFCLLWGAGPKQFFFSLPLYKVSSLFVNSLICIVPIKAA